MSWGLKWGGQGWKWGSQLVLKSRVPLGMSHCPHGGACRGTGLSILLFCHVRTKKEGPHHMQYLDLGLPVSRTVRNECLFFINHPVFGIFVIAAGTKLPVPQRPFQANEQLSKDLTGTPSRPACHQQGSYLLKVTS